MFHLAHISRKKPFRKSFQKKGAPLSQTTHYDRGPGLPDSPPRVRTPRTRNNSSSSKCCSNSCPCLWFRKIARRWLFESSSIAKVSKNNAKMVKMKSRCQNPKGFAPGDLTRPGQRPGEFPLHHEPRHLRGSIRRRSIVHDVIILMAPDCLRINVASLPNYHPAVERSTMVTKPRGNNSWS